VFYISIEDDAVVHFGTSCLFESSILGAMNLVLALTNRPCRSGPALIYRFNAAVMLLAVLPAGVSMLTYKNLAR
jgi:hypothetical protein